MRTLPILLVAMVAAPALSLTPACNRKTSAPAPSSQTTASADLPDRDPALARRLVSQGGVLLDVRTPAEYADRHIQGAANIPVDELSSRSKDVENLTGGDKTKPIVVYCGSGKRAGRAKTILRESGYQQVTNLGGIDDWDRP